MIIQQKKHYFKRAGRFLHQESLFLDQAARKDDNNKNPGFYTGDALTKTA